MTIVIKEVFELTAGLVVASRNCAELEQLGFEQGEFGVELLRPDDTRLTTSAVVGVIFVSPSPPDAPICAIRLPELAKADVPVGTEMRRISEDH